jgi:hypothetical protein
MVCFCILIAMQSFAQAFPHGAASDDRQITCETVQSSEADCPCSDNHENSMCDSVCSCCSIVASLPERVNFHSSPLAAIISPAEPLFVVPQVYFPIFVPPQNCS